MTVLLQKISFGDHVQLGVFEAEGTVLFVDLQDKEGVDSHT